MSNIIKKLGITAGPWKVNVNNTGIMKHYGNYEDVPHSSAWGEDSFSIDEATEESRANDLVIAAAPEMLEDLINLMLFWEGLKDISKITYVDTIQKATGKSWEEIKTLIGGSDE